MFRPIFPRRKTKIESYLERYEIILYYTSYFITMGHQHLMGLISIESNPIDDSLLLGRIESNLSQAESALRDFYPIGSNK